MDRNRVSCRFTYSKTHFLYLLVLTLASLLNACTRAREGAEPSLEISPLESKSQRGSTSSAGASATSEKSQRAHTKRQPKHSNLIEHRPYKLETLPDLQPTESAPLVIYLHGYGASARRLEKALDVERVARSQKFIYAIPEGTPDAHNRRFWNATPACCNFSGADIDDVAYIEALIVDAQSKARIDKRRVFVVGFSNGGFLAHRLACELSEHVTAIAAVSGVTFLDNSKCRPARPVSLLQIHGLDDDIIAYDGGHTFGDQDIPAHPSVPQTMELWAKRDECDAEPVLEGNLDLETDLPGKETSILRYQNCRDSAVELWEVKGGNHFVAFGRRATTDIFNWLDAHPRNR